MLNLRLPDPNYWPNWQRPTPQPTTSALAASLTSAGIIMVVALMWLGILYTLRELLRGITYLLALI